MKTARERDVYRCNARMAPGAVRCYFDRMGQSEHCAGHQDGEDFDDVAYAKWDAERRAKKKKRKRRKPRRLTS